MFVGYARDHAGDWYQMLNMKTKWITETRDDTWLNWIYFKKDKENQQKDEESDYEE